MSPTWCSIHKIFRLMKWYKEYALFIRIRTGGAFTKWWKFMGENLFYFLCFLVVTDWTPILTDSDMTVCLDRPYFKAHFLVHIEIYNSLLPFILPWKWGSSRWLPVPMFWNKWFPYLTKIRIIFPMFHAPRNFICFPVPLHFGNLFPCSP